MTTEGTLQITITKVLLLLTNRCNLLCKHCYVNSSPRGEYGVSLKRSLALIDEIYQNFGRIYFAISGGEALTRRNDCLTLIKYAEGKLKVSLNTNGMLISSVVAKRFAAADLDLILSLDGASASSHDYLRGRGSFDRTLTGIRTLLEAGYPASRLNLIATIPPENINEMPAVLNLADQFSIKYVRIDSLTKAGRARDFWPSHFTGGLDSTLVTFLEQLYSPQFSSQYTDHWELIDLDSKYAQFDTLNIYSNGNVYPYTPLTPSELNENSIGNINQSGLKEIVDGSRRQLEDIIVRKVIEFARCRNKSSRSFLFRRKN